MPSIILRRCLLAAVCLLAVATNGLRAEPRSGVRVSLWDDANITLTPPDNHLDDLPAERFDAPAAEQAELTGISPYQLAEPPTEHFSEVELHPNQGALIEDAYGDVTYRWCDHCRAGNPTQVRRFAGPTNNRAYDGYCVGGGAALFGEGPAPLEATWGWDYFGVHKVVRLGWHHGRYQGGGGTYKTDGPKLELH